MPVVSIDLQELKIEVRGPLHIGTGLARGLTDRTVVRGRDGLVYLPGSALKGKVRAACEAIARQYQMGDCHAPHPQQMRADRGGVGQHRGCIICGMFGAPAQGASLRWHAAPLSQQAARSVLPFGGGYGPFGQTTTRTQVQLSRPRGLAAEERLFTSELAAEGLTFVARPALSGRMGLTRMSDTRGPDAYYELILLLAGIKMVNALGGGKSRGSGECLMELPDTIRLDGRPVEITPLFEYIADLEYYATEEEGQ